MDSIGSLIPFEGGVTLLGNIWPLTYVHRHVMLHRSCVSKKDSLHICTQPFSVLWMNYLGADRSSIYSQLLTIDFNERECHQHCCCRIADGVESKASSCVSGFKLLPAIGCCPKWWASFDGIFFSHSSICMIAILGSPSSDHENLCAKLFSGIEEQAI